MTKQTTGSVAASSPTGETLEALRWAEHAAAHAAMLEEEVDRLLARGRYERRAAIDAPVGYRNGGGKPRRLVPQRDDHGLAQGDFASALHGLLGDGPRCRRRRSRLKAGWQAE